jgi:hypothetical protein
MLIKQLPTMLAELGVLSFVIIGIVAWFKSLGLQGNALSYAAFALGLAFGLCVRYADAPMTDFPAWFVAVVFGLLCGLTATGIYKAGDGLAEKVQKTAYNYLDSNQPK